MINGAIKRALQVAKMRKGQGQPASARFPQAPVPKREDMPVDLTRSKSAQERQKFQDGGGSIMFQKNEPERVPLPLRPYEQRFNPKSGELDAAERKDIGFYGPIENPMTGHEITEYSSDRDFQYPTVYEGMSDADRAAIMMAERLGKNAPRNALAEVDDRAYAQAQKRKAKGRSPFYEPGKDTYPKWSPEQHWDEPTGMPKDDGLYFADGGTVERPTKMNDKVKHALDVALSETHPKRLHHTLARTGYAEGGLPDMDTSPADLANEVPYTHAKALASPFDVAQSAPFKPKGIKLGATKIAPLKKRGIRAPRADLGKMRMKKARLAKPGKLKFAEGGHPEIDDALRLASRTMSDMAKNIGDEGVHGASMQQGSTSTIVKEKVPGKKSEIVYEHHAKTPTETETFASGGGAWTRKEGKNPEGGLNAKGRASLKAQGHDIRPPAPHPKTEKDAARRKSFCARMSGMPGPMKDDNGKPTRKALSLRVWNCRADGGRLMHQDIIDALRLAEDRQNYAVGGFGRQKGRTSVTSPAPSGYKPPITNQGPGIGLAPPANNWKESGGMFIPSEVSGRRSELNPFRPNPAPAGDTFQANLGRPDMIPTDANGKPLPSNLPTGLMMPDDPNNPNTKFRKPTQEEMYGYKDSGGMFIPSEVSGRRSALNPFRPNPAPAGDTFQADLGRPNPYQDYVSSTLRSWIMKGGGERPRMELTDLVPINRNELSPEQRYRYDQTRQQLAPKSKPPLLPGTPGPALPPGYKGSGVNPELVAGYRPPITNQGPGIGLAPPALPPGLDYNTMPPSVRQMFEPRQPSRPAPPPPMMPPMASPGPSNPAVNPVGMIPDFMNGAGQGQMPQPTPLEQLGQPYPMMPQQAAPMPQPTMPQQMMPQQASPVFQPFANAGQQQPFFGGTGTKAGPSVGGLYRRR